MSIEFAADNRPILEAALDAMGLAYTVAGQRVSIASAGIVLDLQAKRATLPASAQEMLNQIKRGYALQAVQTAARAKGWTVRTTAAAGQTAVGQIVRY